MKTTVYFIRHAESDRTVRDGRIRPLTKKGYGDAQNLVKLFKDIKIDRIYSSPFKRAVDTVSPLAVNLQMDIMTVEDFRERRSDSVQTISMEELIRIQWKDFGYTLSDGECLREVQDRNIKALRETLENNKGRSIAIGTHGMALCTIIRYFRSELSESEMERIMSLLPYILCMEFENDKYIGMNEIEFNSD